MYVCAHLVNKMNSRNTSQHGPTTFCKSHDQCDLFFSRRDSRVTKVITTSRTIISRTTTYDQATTTCDQLVVDHPRPCCDHFRSRQAHAITHDLSNDYSVVTPFPIAYCFKFTVYMYLRNVCCVNDINIVKLLKAIKM